MTGNWGRTRMRFRTEQPLDRALDPDNASFRHLAIDPLSDEIHSLGLGVCTSGDYGLKDNAKKRLQNMNELERLLFYRELKWAFGTAAGELMEAKISVLHAEILELKAETRILRLQEDYGLKPLSQSTDLDEEKKLQELKAKRRKLWREKKWLKGKSSHELEKKPQEITAKCGLRLGEEKKKLDGNCSHELDLGREIPTGINS